ncbi:MAG: IMPACT family protein [Prevotellaceae bacterium]|nr:IMPACT family protein [Prevotellaceae bacterium]
MLNDSYLTITAPAEGTYREKGSKFFAFVFPVQSEEQVAEIVTDLRKRFYDARHVCYAYRIGYEQPRFRTNDDGEPSGTAGKPIYGQILANNLSDILIAVVRYFGGILLGTSGLIVAYKTAAADAIAHTQIEERIIEVTLIVRCGYEQLNPVMRIIKELSLNVTEHTQTLNCTLTLRVRQSLLQEVITRFERLPLVIVERITTPDRL